MPDDHDDPFITLERLRAEVARLTREAEWAHRGWDDAREHADQHEKESDVLRTLLAQLVGIVRDMLAVGSYRDLPELIERARAPEPVAPPRRPA